MKNFLPMKRESPGESFGQAAQQCVVIRPAVVRNVIGKRSKTVIRAAHIRITARVEDTHVGSLDDRIAIFQVRKPDAVRAHIAHVERHAIEELAFNAEVVVINVRRLQMDVGEPVAVAEGEIREICEQVRIARRQRCVTRKWIGLAISPIGIAQELRKPCARGQRIAVIGETS